MRTKLPDLLRESFWCSNLIIAFILIKNSNVNIVYITSPFSSRISMFGLSIVQTMSPSFIKNFMFNVNDASVRTVEVCSDKSLARMITSESDKL